MSDREHPTLEPAPAWTGAGRLCSVLLAAWFTGGAFLTLTASAPGAGAPYRPLPAPPSDNRGLSPPGAAAEAIGYADGAPPGFSGGFTEQSCHACHFEAEINTKPGAVTLTGLPERFAGGEKIPITVTLTRPGLKLGGFQLAARFEDGTQAGMLERGTGEDKRLAIETQGTVHYANQRRAGANPTAADSAAWTLVWTAPASDRAVTFHVAANAADNDESVRGDYIYTTAVTTRPR